MAMDERGTPEDGEPTRLEIGKDVLVQFGVAPATLSGRTISHFQVGEAMGGGGMGVVYKAEDTRLGRTVALKFLAPELVRDPLAKARFLTEARAASALEHPNLCTILEVAEEDGLLFLAMPCYEGESLENRLARGPLSLEEALEIAVQTARGLAKAHQNGIVHRDVKPGNLFLTHDGVKILDFGIAKLTGEAGPTQLGSILGTPAYMAPEQTRGEAIDARADVWSLGVVLYEMLTRRKPFTGGNGFAVVNAVLHDAPEPVSRFQPGVPPELERILSRMLAKNPKDRYADAGEVLLALRKELSLPTTGNLTLSAMIPPHRRRGRYALGMAAAALAVLTLAVLLFVLWRKVGLEEGPQPGQIVRLTDLPGGETSPSLSPDGTFVAYAKSTGGNFDIFVQRVAGGNPINLTADSPADDIQPAFSPDGQQIAFRSERDGGGIFLMGATGESVRRLTDVGFNPAWSPDGQEIAVATEGAFDPTSRYSFSQIFRISLSTGAKRSLAVRDGVQPSWSPHRQRIAFWGLAHPGARRAIWTLPVDGGTPLKVVDDGFYNWSPVWSPDGRFLYFASNRGGSMNLWRVPIDEPSGRTLGEPQPITTSSEWSALPSLSRDGRHMVFATNSSRSFVEQVPLDPSSGLTGGSPAVVYQGARSILSCDVSPDGAWLVLWASSPSEDLLLIRSDGSELRQLTNDLARDRTPFWSPDGSRILFASDRSGKYEAWTIRADGSSLTQVTHLPDRPVLSPFWSPDGRTIGFNYVNHGTALLDLGGRSKPRVLPSAGGGHTFAGVDWSADGRFLAGKLLRPDEASVPGIILWSLADNTYRRLTLVGQDLSLSRDGGRIFFTQDGKVQIVSVGNGEVRTVLSPPPHSSYVSVSVGPGDKNLCTVRLTDEGDIWSLALDGHGPSEP